MIATPEQTMATNQVGIWVPGLSEGTRADLSAEKLERVLGPLLGRFSISLAQTATDEEVDRFDYHEALKTSQEESEERGYEIGLAAIDKPRPATASDLLPFIAIQGETHPNLTVELIRFNDEMATKLGKAARELTLKPDFMPNHGPDMELAPGLFGSLIDWTDSLPFEPTTTMRDPRTDKTITKRVPALLHVDNWERLPRATRIESRRRVGMVTYGERRVLLGPDCFRISDEVYGALEADNPKTKHTKESRIPNARDFHAYVTRNLGEVAVLGIKLLPGEGYIIPTENVFHDGSSYDSLSSGIAFWHYRHGLGKLPPLFSSLTPATRNQTSGAFGGPPPQITRPRTRLPLDTFDGDTLVIPEGTVIIEPERRAHEAEGMGAVLQRSFVPTYANELLGLSEKRLAAYTQDPAWLDKKIAHYASLIENEQANVTSALLRGRVVGQTAVVDTLNANGKLIRWLDAFYADPSLHGRRIGLTMLWQALWPSPNAKDVYVVYAPHTEVARFYQWLGFGLTGNDVSHMQAELPDGYTIPLVEAMLPVGEIHNALRRIRSRLPATVRP